MNCVVAIVLAVVGVVASNPVSPLGVGYAGLGAVSPLVVPSYSVSSSWINHGVTIPRVVVPAPVIRPVVSAPIITSPIVRTPIVSVPVPVRTTLLAPSVGYGLGYGTGWGISKV